MPTILDVVVGDGLYFTLQIIKIVFALPTASKYRAIRGVILEMAIQRLRGT